MHTSASVDSCRVVGKGTLHRLSPSLGVVDEIPVPGWPNARDCHFKAYSSDRYLDVIVWDSVDRPFSEVVDESHLNASDQVTPVEVPGAARAELITTSRDGAAPALSITTLVALRDGVVFVSMASSVSGRRDEPIARALMNRILARTA